MAEFDFPARRIGSDQHPKATDEPLDAGTVAHARGSLFVRRPVLAIVLNLLIVLAGLASLGSVEVRELPNIDSPVITIRTSYPGASPETVEKEITSRVESAVARTPGLKTMNSQSSSGQSRVTLEFHPSADIDIAANDLRDQIGAMRGLPDDAGAPVIVKADADASAIMRLAVISPTMSIQELTQLVDSQIVSRLAQVAGVADVQQFGDRLPLMRIIIDPYALAARGLTVNDLQSALSSVTLDVPAGTISGPDNSLIVRADATARSQEEIAAIQVKPGVHVSDVASVVLGPAEQVTALRINGQTGIGLGIVRQAQSNTLAVSSGVRAAVEELNRTLSGARVVVTGDDANFINGALEEVLITLGLATAIVVAIIYLFLRSTLVTLIPAVTVPIALLGTVAAILLSGFSINILTLLALVLATGLVVDDAIVVIENIARFRAAGMGARAAAVLGTRQVFFAVISTTATLVAVFVPVSFMPGAAGRLFKEFGFVLAFSVIISIVVALTLTPMMASRLIHRDSGEPRSFIGRAIAALGRGAAALYARLLNAALAAPMVVVLVAALFAGGAVFAYQLLPEELTPPEDRGSIFVSVSAPQGTTVGYVQDQLRAVERIVQPYIDSGEVTNTFMIARGVGGFGGTSGGTVALTLASWHDRHRNQMEITAELNRQLQQIPGIQVFARTSNSLGIRGGGQGLTFSLLGPDYGELADAADQLRLAIQNDPHFGQNVQVNYNTTQSEVAIAVDRQRAASVGVPVESVTNTIGVLLAGREIGEYYMADNVISIRMEIPGGLIQDTSSLDNIQVRTSSGQMIPLSSLATVTERAVAPSLPRQNQQRAVPMSAQLADGVDLRAGMSALEAIAAQQLPLSMTLAYTGEAAQLQETSSGVLLTFGFALLIVLLVLAAQFESFVSAFVLLATVPFGLASAVYAMLLSGGSLNIYSQIGLVMLVGLMSKNGILIVEFANQLREHGRSVSEAIREASLIRLRPVVMTMVATVLGGLPLLLRGGAGAEARHALGWIIVGGLGFATISTLFLTPVVYRLVAGLAKPRSAEAERLSRELAAAEGRPARRGRRRAAEREEQQELPIAAE